MGRKRLGLLIRSLTTVGEKARGDPKWRLTHRPAPFVAVYFDNCLCSDTVLISGGFVGIERPLTFAVGQNLVAILIDHRQVERHPLCAVGTLE